MKLSIITPCTRPFNLPIMYKSITNQQNQFDSVEWIIVYDSKCIDERIKVYEESVEIKLYNHISKSGDPYAAYVRNEGLKHVTGDLIYYLDDDNIVHPNLFKYINKYYENDKILVFNQADENFSTRLPTLNLEELTPGYIDTAQFVVPSIYKDMQWVHDGPYNDETPYLQSIVDKYGLEAFKTVNQVVSYRNFIKRNPV